MVFILNHKEITALIAA